MSDRTEHIARLTEMSVRAQEAADWLAGQDDAPMADDLAKKDAHVERLLTDIRGLVQRAEAAERERDAAMQAHADDIAEKDAQLEQKSDDYWEAVSRGAKRYADVMAERDTLRQELDAATDERRDAEQERERASQGWCQALESNKHLLDRIRELEDAAEPNERVNFAAVAEELQEWNNPAAPKFVLHHCDYGDIVRTVLASALINECDTVDHYTDDPCTGIYERSDDEVDDYYCCLRHGHDGDHVNEDGWSWPDTAETAPREPEDAASPGPAHPDGTSEAHFHTRPQSAGESESTASREPETPGFQVGETVWHVESGTTGEVVSLSRVGSVHVTFDGNHTADGYNARGLRHVYDADHEPPEGVNLLRGMDDHGYCLERDGGLWALTTSDGRWISSSPWGIAAYGKTLVEWREGDR